MAIPKVIRGKKGELFFFETLICTVNKNSVQVYKRGFRVMNKLEKFSAAAGPWNQQK